MPVRLRRPSPALVVAMIALFVALGGPAQAKQLINGKLIRKGTVSSKQIRDRGITPADLSKSAVKLLQRTPARSVGSAELADGAVGPSQLKAGSVTAGALAVNSLTGATIADATVGTADLADNAVVTEKIATSGVRKADIGAGAVGQSEISSSAVTGTEVADGSLSARDISDFSDPSGGPLSVSFPSVPFGSCVQAAAPTPVIVPNVSGATLLDDIVIVGQPAGLKPNLTISARPADLNTLRFSICNASTKTTDTEPAFTTTVRFLAIQP